MAELIRKDKLIDWSYRVPQYYDSMNDRTDMRDFINSLPTTTEAEIRAMAYDKACLKLHQLLVGKMFKYGLTPIEIDWICDELAEQLKEE
jgi:hypothetical protein